MKNQANMAVDLLAEDMANIYLNGENLNLNVTSCSIFESLDP